MQASHATATNPYYLGEEGDRAFRALNAAVQANANRHAQRAFHTVNTEGLWEVFLAAFDDPEERRMHNCHCCLRFIDRAGGLVEVDAQGNVESLLWDAGRLSTSTPRAYVKALLDLKRVVESRRVVGQALLGRRRIGEASNGGFSHFSVAVETAGPAVVETQHQAEARRHEDRKHLEACYRDLKPELIEKTVAMLEAGGLSRAEALLPMGRFLLDVHRATKGLHGDARNNAYWYFVATAAPGWCTPRDSAFAALCFDVAAGRAITEVSRSHEARVAPGRYQRPQAAPSAGNVAAAEKLFEKLGLAPSLERRPMRADEAQYLWQPKSVAPRGSSGGVFAGVRTKDAAPEPTVQLSARPVMMSLAKFSRDVLPGVLSLRAVVPQSGSFGAFTTAVHPDAPPILSWDRPDARNPGAWYLYTRGSRAEQWALGPGERTRVLGICRLPCDWAEPRATHISEGRVMFVLEGARDVGNPKAYLFPECLRSELHPVRSTIEAHQENHLLADESEARASGWVLSDHAPLVVEATSAHGVADYWLDRLE